PQRGHVPGVAAGRGPGRIACLRHRRARLWGAPQRQAAFELATALPQLAAQQRSALGTPALTCLLSCPPPRPPTPQRQPPPPAPARRSVRNLGPRQQPERRPREGFERTG